MRRGVCMWLVALVLVLTVSVMGTEEGEGLPFDAFLAWFKEVGGEAAALSLSAFPAMGTGIMAVSEVKEDDLIISVPMDYVICRSTAMKLAKGDSAARKMWRSVESDEVLVAMYIVREKALGEASRWAPYISVLPSFVPVAFQFSESDLDALQDPQQSGRARMRRKQILEAYAGVAKDLSDELRRAGASALSAEEQQESYLWALSLVHSRALTLQGVKFLVPFADMFNYQPHKEERESASGAHFLKYHGQNLNKDRFEVRADRPTAPGEQMYEDYGDNDNALYMHHHGFVAVDNPFDCVDVALPELKRSDPLIQSKRALLRTLRLSRDMPACLNPRENHVPRRVFDWLEVVYMKSDGLRLCEGILNGETTRAEVARCLGQPDDADGYRRLAKALKRQLKAYSTSDTTDRRLLSSGKLSETRYTAVAFRMTRKQMLSELINTYSSPPATQEPEVATPTPTPAPSIPSASVAVESDGSIAAEDGGDLAPNRGEKDRSYYESLVTTFNAWFAAADPPVALIEAAVAPDGMRLGTTAVRDIVAEEPYLSVPLTLIMDEASAFRCPQLGPVLRKLRRRFPKGDPFHELLFHLVYEKFARPLRGEESFWKPYLDYLPTADEMLFPMYYSEKELDEIQSSLVREQAESYKGAVQRKFDSLEGLLREYSDVFDPRAFTFANYKWAHALLDSRSIWWSNGRHLVPLLDLINCAEGPDPERVHSTRLSKDESSAVTLAPWAFEKATAVYENYGQPNHIYFQYHGFSLDTNSHDCVRIRLEADASMESKLKEKRYHNPHVACVNPDNIERRDLRFIELAFKTGRKGALPYLAQHAAKFLASYDTSVEEDEALLEQPGHSQRFLATLRFRLSEKRLLTKIAALTPEEDL